MTRRLLLYFSVALLVFALVIGGVSDSCSAAIL